MQRIIHRANGGNYPENTLEAVEWAVGADADAIEIDVMLSADGIPVLSHDHKLKRMSDTEKKVGELTLAELKNLKLHSTHLEKEGTFATLNEAIEIIKGKKKLYLELKVGDVKKLVESVLNAVDGTLSSDDYVISSFDPTFLSAIKSKRPEIETAYIFSNPFRRIFLERTEKKHGNFEQWHFEKWMLRTNIIEKGQRAGKKVVPWIVNTKNEMRRCINKGADGIITDEIGLLNEVLSE